MHAQPHCRGGRGGAHRAGGTRGKSGTPKKRTTASRGVTPAAKRETWAARSRAVAWFARATPRLPPSMATRTDCAALCAQATPWRTPTSSGSSTAAFGSWSTRWLPHMLERWSAQPPPPTHRACHHRLTPPQLAADILVPVALQEAAGPCKGGVMTGGSVAPCTRAGAPFGGRGLSHTVGRGRCSRWRRLACGWACAVCHLSCL